MPEIGNTSVFSQTDANNNSGTAPSWSGSALPSTLDDAGRAIQGAVTREWNWRNFTLTAAGTADAKTLTYSVAPAAYYNGQRFAFIANTTNTGSATLNVNSVGAKTIKSMLTGTLANLSASNMVAGMYVEVAYNTSNDCFVWVNQGPTSVPFTAASASGAASLAFAEDTDNGTNVATLQGAASLSGDITLTLPSAAGTIANTSDFIGQQTIWVPAAAMTTRTTNGAASGSVETTTNKVMLSTMDFDATTAEYAQFAVQMPKGWDESTIICQFVWSHAATVTNFGVAWELAAVAFADDDAADTAFGSAVTVTDTGGTTNDIYISAESSAMTVAGSPGAEEYVVFQVNRAPANGSDTMAVDARLHGVKIHYTINAAKDD
jgi:hypothetical protein